MMMRNIQSEAENNFPEFTLFLICPSSYPHVFVVTDTKILIIIYI